ncbi:hypothetical protein SY88_23790 [Clostridiales bacterium PH28_bin88]|nr:hypothetical protein SY88_23790 [Clostridiales bacterium PH28_bin88]
MLEKQKQGQAVLIDLDGAKALSELIQAMGHDPAVISVADLQRIAERLAAIARKDPPWGWRYLRNVLNWKIEASRKLMDAIMRLGAVIDETPVELAQSERVTVQALGQVRPGALVLADSRPCANPLCGIEFVPRHPRQVYHAARCRGSNHRGHKDHRDLRGVMR